MKSKKIMKFKYFKLRFRRYGFQFLRQIVHGKQTPWGYVVLKSHYRKRKKGLFCEKKTRIVRIFFLVIVLETIHEGRWRAIYKLNKPLIKYRREQRRKYA